MTIEMWLLLVAALAFAGAAALGWYRWRTRRDVWITMHGACLFQVGDCINVHGTAGPEARARIIQVTRYAVKVRPL